MDAEKLFNLHLIYVILNHNKNQEKNHEKFFVKFKKH